MFLDGSGGPIDEKTGARWYLKAAEQNDGIAQAMLIDLYSIGRGVPRDGAKAREWAEKAMESGGRARAMAMYSLGEMYAKGDGVPRQPKKAVYWMRKAARENYGRGMAALAGYYKNGLGDMPPYTILAVAWLRQARTRGIDRDTLHELETLEAGLTGTQSRAAKEAYQRIEDDSRKAGAQEQEPR